MNDDHERPPDPIQHREREFDAIALVLASILATIVIGAIGYGIFNSSRMASTVPSLTAASPHPARSARPRPDPNIPDAQATTGASDQRR